MKKAAIFILLGQSNAAGHGIPMADRDRIMKPLKNVFGLSRTLNQSYDNKSLDWTGYTSFDMNLAESQDNTYSVANWLAKMWQEEIDSGYNLPDLHIVHIAIGAQGVTEGYMWYPEREKVMKPGRVWRVDISAYPFCTHIFSLLEDSFKELGKEAEYYSLHWRGGENDFETDEEKFSKIEDIYNTLFNGFYDAIGKRVPTVLHKFYFNALHPNGNKNKDVLNALFDKFAAENNNIETFDVTECPLCDPSLKRDGIYMDDLVHYTPELNKWVAEKILEDYKRKILK